MQIKFSRRKILQACGAAATSVAISGCSNSVQPIPLPPPPTAEEVDSRQVALEPVWKRIVAWHQKHTPGVLKLRSGAKPEQIDALEHELGVRLPADVRASLLLHNGGEDASWLLDQGELLSTAGILSQWKMYRQMQARGQYAVPGHSAWQPREIKGPIKPIFWNTKRIHLTDNSGEHLTIDLDPPADGTLGQVIRLGDVGPTKVLAKSWAEFLSQVADDLEAGKYVYDKEEETVLLRGM